MRNDTNFHCAVKNLTTMQKCFLCNKQQSDHNTIHEVRRTRIKTSQKYILKNTKKKKKKELPLVKKLKKNNKYQREIKRN